MVIPESQWPMAIRFYNSNFYFLGQIPGLANCVQLFHIVAHVYRL